MGDERDEKPRPYRRLTEAERARFLAVLAETGNRKAAAGAIGVEPRSMDQRRESDPALDRAWREAVEAAQRRLAPASGPFDLDAGGAGAGCGGGAGMIRRGKKGRLQIVSCGEGRWSAAVEARFLARLRTCGCVRTAARWVGFNENSVWQRRRIWPAFAEAMDAMLDEAELALEYRIAAHANNIVGAAEPAEAAEDVEDPEVTDANQVGSAGPAEGSAPMDRFDIEAAYRFLKWREEKRRGGKGRAPQARAPSIEDVTETIVRRVEAIKRHRRGPDPAP